MSDEMFSGPSMYLQQIKCDTCGEVFKPEAPINGPQAKAFVREFRETHPCQGQAWINQIEGRDL